MCPLPSAPTMKHPAVFSTMSKRSNHSPHLNPRNVLGSHLLIGSWSPLKRVESKAKSDTNSAEFNWVCRQLKKHVVSETWKSRLCLIAHGKGLTSKRVRNLTGANARAVCVTRLPPPTLKSVTCEHAWPKFLPRIP